MNALVAALAILPAVLARVQGNVVSLDARGQDVREVLATLFAQAKKSYALDASIRGSLYMRLDHIEYEKALDIVLTQARLTSRVQDGVVIVSVAAPKPTTVAERPPVTKPVAVKKAAPVVVKKAPAQPPITAILDRKVTTQLSKTPITTVFATLGRQAGAKIEVDRLVPAYKIDARFSAVTLRTALDKICGAAGLERNIVNGVIWIRPKTE